MKTTAVDLLAEELRPLLENGENVANLVLISMVCERVLITPRSKVDNTAGKGGVERGKWWTRELMGEGKEMGSGLSGKMTENIQLLKSLFYSASSLIFSGSS